MLATRARMAAGAGGGGSAQYALTFNATSSLVDCGNNSSLNNLPASAVTLEYWIRPQSAGEANLGKPFHKQHITSWLTSSNQIVFRVSSDGGNSTATAVAAWATNTWVHVAHTYDNGGDRKARTYINGSLSATAPTACAGTIRDDSSYNLIFGNDPTAVRTIDGDMSWFRLSDNIRYSGPFTPAAKDAPPASDGNTVEQWNLNDGSGATAAAEESTPTNDGAITDGSWTEL